MEKEKLDELDCLLHKADKDEENKISEKNGNNTKTFVMPYMPYPRIDDVNIKIETKQQVEEYKKSISNYDIIILNEDGNNKIIIDQEDPSFAVIGIGKITYKEKIYSHPDFILRDKIKIKNILVKTKGWFGPQYIVGNDLEKIKKFVVKLGGIPEACEILAVNTENEFSLCNSSLYILEE